MAAALGEANAPPVAAPEEEETPRFCVGELVEVKPRTFPGMNKPGGTATIRKVHDEREKDGGPMKDGSVKRTTGFTYAVKYVLNGSEKRVDAQWISAKVEVSREEAQDARREEAAKRKAEREAEEARKLQEEAERQARKRAAREKVKQLRAAKAARTNRRRPRSMRGGSVVGGGAARRRRRPSPRSRRRQMDARRARGRAARVADEVDLEALFAAALAVPPPPGASNDEAAVRDLLGKLEADNCVMVCEGTVFLV